MAQIVVRTNAGLEVHVFEVDEIDLRRGVVSNVTVALFWMELLEEVEVAQTLDDQTKARQADKENNDGDSNDHDERRSRRRAV